MSKIESCHRCGGNIVTPAYEGDGAYPVGRMCECAYQSSKPPCVQRSSPVRPLRWSDERNGEWTR